MFARRESGEKAGSRDRGPPRDDVAFRRRRQVSFIVSHITPSTLFYLFGRKKQGKKLNKGGNLLAINPTLHALHK